MTSPTTELAQRAMALQPGDLPPDVAERARQCLLDWLGVTVAGSGEKAARLLFDELADAEPTGGATTVVGRRERLGLYSAAIANGTASHALDYDDVNWSMFGHPTVPILAGLLALAEQRDATGAEVLCSFAAGYEAECRLGQGLGAEHYRRGFHATATVGTFGAALACARLLRLDPRQAETAIGLAAAQAAGLKSMFGTMAKPLQAGRASATGLLSARLAARGYTAAQGAVEGSQGFAETHTGALDAALVSAPPPRGWYLREHLFKYHASCFQTHSTIEGIRRLREAERFRAADVVRVTVHAEPAQLRMCAIPEPATGLEVKFSLHHTAAMALAGRDTAAVGAFSDETVIDAEVLGLRSRVELVVDRPDGGPTPVDVHLRDGRVLRAAHDVWAPDDDLASQRAALVRKCTALAGPVVGDAVCEKIVALVDGFEHLTGVAELLAATRPS